MCGLRRIRHRCWMSWHEHASPVSQLYPIIQSSTMNETRHHRHISRLMAFILTLAFVFTATPSAAYAADFRTVMYEEESSQMQVLGQFSALHEFLSSLFAQAGILQPQDEAVDSSAQEEEISGMEESGTQEPTISDTVSQTGLSFYQKLALGMDVNILIIGDSIGAGAGASSTDNMWFTLLEEYLMIAYYPDDYLAEVTAEQEGTSTDLLPERIHLTNLSMGGNDSYAGYVTAMAFNDGIDYDLVILCYGQNDSEAYCATFYEAMIRAVKTNYPNSCLMSILESSQQDYTNKILDEVELCEYYEIPMVDMIAAFANSGYDNTALTYDGLHPSDLGQWYYAQCVFQAIMSCESAGMVSTAMPEPLDEEVLGFDSFVYYAAGGMDADNTLQLQRISSTSYIMKLQAEGTIGIHYSYSLGDSVPDIYIDGELCEKPEVLCENDFTEGLIQVVAMDGSIEEEIRLDFATSEQADGFLGLCISW